MKKRIVLRVIIAIIVICAVVAVFFVANKVLKGEEKTTGNTYIYDKDGEEIASINYGDTSFFDNIKSYYLALVIDDVINDIEEKESVNEDEAKNILATGEYKIYTCEDSNLQSKLEDTYKNYNNFLEDAEAATTILDNETGSIVAIVGGRNVEDKAITFGDANNNPTAIQNKNKAIEYYEPAQSMISLLSVYACGLEKGTFTLESKYVDEPLQVGTWKPTNYYSGYKGEMTIEEAIKGTTNIVKVKAMQDIGVDTAYEFLENLGISSLSEEYDKTLAISLGLLTNGCNLLDLSSAYRTVLTDGEYKEPISYLKVVDKKGKNYLENIQETRKVLKESVCADLKSCIKKDINRKEVYVKSIAATNHTCDWSSITTDNYTLSTWYGSSNEKSFGKVNSSDIEAEKLSVEVLNKIS